MKVGDLVRYEDGDIGIITQVRTHDYRVHWGDGCWGWHLLSELEVLCR